MFIETRGKRDGISKNRKDDTDCSIKREHDAWHCDPALAEDLSDTEASSVELESEDEIDLEEDDAVDSSSAEEVVAETAADLAVSEGKYLKELRMAAADSETEAKAILTNAGYSVIDQNVNTDASKGGSDDKAVYIGYTTTTDINEAVRDIALMNMKGGYYTTDFETAIADQLATYIGIESDLYTIINEFRSNYYAGSPLAVRAYEELNRFIEDDSGMLVGDYILKVDITKTSTKDDISDFLTFYSTISKNAMAIVNTWLSYGLGTYGEGKTSFLTRVADMTESEKEAARTNRLNISDAEMLLPYFQEYADAMNDLADDIDEHEIDAEMLSEDGQDELTAEEQYLILGDAYFDYLEEYEYDDATLMEISLNDDVASEDLTLLVSQMSDAQKAAVKYVGFEQVLKTELMDVNSWDEEADAQKYQDKMEERIAEMIKNVAEESKAYEETLEEDQPLSIYYGIDRSEITGKVAVTSEAIRQMDATSDYSALAQTDGSYDLFAGLAVGIGALAGLTCLGVGIYMLYTRTAEVVEELPLMYYDVVTHTFVEHIDTETFVRTSTPKTVGGVTLIGASIAVFALIITVIVLWKQYKDTHKIFDKGAVPDTLIDLKTTKTGIPYYVRYTSVKEFTPVKGELDPGDVNGFVGDEWNVLYTTTNVDVGDPIQAEFRVALDTADKKENEFGIHAFGSTVEANLNSYTYNAKNGTKIYLYAKKGAVTPLIGSMFSGAGGYVAILIIGILLGAALMAVFEMIRRRRKMQIEKSCN